MRYTIDSFLDLPKFDTETATAPPKVGTFDASSLPEWDFTGLYNGMDDPKIEQDFSQAAKDIDKFEKTYKGQLDGLLTSNQQNAAQRAEILATAVLQYEAMSDLLGGIISYAYLVYAQLATNPERIKFLGDVQERLTELGTKTLFFELELNRIETAKIDELLTFDCLLHHAPWLKDIRREKPHQLSDELEQLFAEKSVTAAGSWTRLFEETMASLQFKLDDQDLTLSQVLNLITSPDGATRKKAATSLSDVLAKNKRLFTHVTNVLAKDKAISDKWRGFEDVAASRHLANRVEPAVVDALEASVRKAYPKLSHRYYALKAKWFGVEKLDQWDRNAPLPNVETPDISYQDACDIILEAYAEFSPEMADITAKFFDNGWIDARSREGKAAGAFAHPTVPSQHPYVMVNYLGRTRDVMTLAHELGHGVHQYLANQQGALMAPTPLTLAETASVFGEMLTFRSMLKKTRSATEKRSMLASKIEDMLNTVVRQICFYSFERKVHLARKDGELTTEQLGEFWLEVSAESLGPSVILNEGYEHYWSYIPHFIRSPFYVYAYAFGDCLVNSLYACYLAEPDGFADKYFDLLKAGGSQHHSELLAPFGLDASDEVFWDMGLEAISVLIDELEALEGQ
ncbi:MAG: M3 family oligoendopeptidase [Rhizobiales bacterium]|nr:M3 family oligoendopeptidase [Hyphomicrobiales bacterium]NRB14198.1 M3 family oligoendopeptidase [Hyphomicrobiales bacterium]